MKGVLELVRKWDAEGLKSAEAILVATQHSSPRMPGARLVVNENGAAGGAVSMGCVESDLREHLLALIRGEGESRIIHYGSSFSETMEVGLSCGGEIDVWIRLHDANSPVFHSWGSRWTRAMLLTELRPGGGQMVWRPGEPLPAPVLQEEIDRLWIQGGARRLRSPGGMWFAEVWAPNPSLLMVGASPIATALCDLATRVGFRVWVVDPRRDFARRELFPAAVEVIHQWPEEGLKTAGLDRESYVAVLAHDAKLDVPAVASALRADCRYVGLLGSPSTQEDRRRALMKMGVSEEAMRRIHGPIGLKSLGGIEPGEIAVSILAEMIQVRRGKREKR